jgi:hypothetical protein
MTWVALFEVFHKMYGDRLAPRESWESLSFLIYKLKENRSFASWRVLESEFAAMDRDLKMTTLERRNHLYNMLDDVWEDEKKFESTPRELAFLRREHDKLVCV